MNLQKQKVYIPIEGEHDDECFFITDSEEDYLGAIKKEDKYVFSEEELRYILNNFSDFGYNHLDNVGKWESDSKQSYKTDKEERINNLLKQD